MTKLTAKQQRFVDEYLVDLNATQAAIRAGYSERTAYRTGADNLKKPQIKSFIEERMKAKEDSLIAKQDEVLKFLTSILRGEETEETLRGVGEGAQTITDIEVGAKDRIKAAELLGKRYAMWTDKKEIDGDLGLNLVIDYGDEDDS